MLSFLRCLDFCPDIFDYVRKQRFHKKANVNFKNFNVKDWTTK